VLYDLAHIGREVALAREGSLSYQSVVIEVVGLGKVVTLTAGRTNRASGKDCGELQTKTTKPIKLPLDLLV
jgi:hypothetical protein